MRNWTGWPTCAMPRRRERTSGPATTGPCPGRSGQHRPDRWQTGTIRRRAVQQVRARVRRPAVRRRGRRPPRVPVRPTPRLLPGRRPRAVDPREVDLPQPGRHRLGHRRCVRSRRRAGAAAPLSHRRPDGRRQACRARQYHGPRRHPVRDRRRGLRPRPVRRRRGLRPHPVLQELRGLRPHVPPHPQVRRRRSRRSPLGRQLLRGRRRPLGLPTLARHCPPRPRPDAAAPGTPPRKSRWPPAAAGTPRTIRTRPRQRPAAEPATIGLETIGQETVGLETIGLETVGSETIEPGRTGPGRTHPSHRAAPSRGRAREPPRRRYPAPPPSR